MNTEHSMKDIPDLCLRDHRSAINALRAIASDLRQRGSKHHDNINLAEIDMLSQLTIDLKRIVSDNRELRKLSRRYVEHLTIPMLLTKKTARAIVEFNDDMNDLITDWYGLI